MAKIVVLFLSFFFGFDASAARVKCLADLGLLASSGTRPATLHQFLSEGVWGQADSARANQIAFSIELDWPTVLTASKDFPAEVRFTTFRGSDTLFITLDQFHPVNLEPATEVNLANTRMLIDLLQGVKSFATSHTQSDLSRVRIFARVSTQPMAVALAKAGFQVVKEELLVPLTEEHLALLLNRGMRAERAPTTIGMMIELIP